MRLVLVSLIALSVYGQATRSVSLAWTHSAPAGLTYNMYRASGSCTPRPTMWTKLNTAPITAMSYLDQNVALGSWCYYVTAVGGGLESGPSNDAGAAVAPRPPEGLNGTVAIAEITVDRDGALAAKLEVKVPAK